MGTGNLGNRWLIRRGVARADEEDLGCRWALVILEAASINELSPVPPAVRRAMQKRRAFVSRYGHASHLQYRRRSIRDP